VPLSVGQGEQDIEDRRAQRRVYLSFQPDIHDMTSFKPEYVGKSPYNACEYI
jgi:hypothetical protein